MVFSIFTFNSRPTLEDAATVKGEYAEYHEDNYYANEDNVRPTYDASTGKGEPLP
jgi:hypothetical protein